jgi:hypothetical protein
MPSAERGVVACGGQGGSMAGSKGARRPEGERIKRRGGSKASKRDWHGILRAAGRVSTVPGWGMGGMGGMGGLRAVGNWKPVGAAAVRAHIHGAHSRHSFKAVEGEHGRLSESGAWRLPDCNERQASAFGPSACVWACVVGLLVCVRACWTPTSEAWNCRRRRGILRFVDTARLPSCPPALDDVVD